MRDTAVRHQHLLLKLATPYSIGTGFYLRTHNLIITNEYTIRDHQEVVVEGLSVERQLARPIYFDSYYDLAFLRTAKPLVLPDLPMGEAITEDMPILALGQPENGELCWKEGQIRQTDYPLNDLEYVHHSATLPVEHSGGPLLDTQGRLIGLNFLDEQSGNGLALPIAYIEESIVAFSKGGGQPAARCFNCRKVVFESEHPSKYCPHCSARLLLPSDLAPYEPTGLQYTVEQIIEATGNDVRLTRRGPNTWEITQGSAKIAVSYHEESGLITGDAYLVQLPKGDDHRELFEFLLRQNYELENLTFSVKKTDIILSLLIFDRYLNVETGLRLFRHLFERADYYDDVLVDTYSAQWK